MRKLNKRKITWKKDSYRNLLQMTKRVIEEFAMMCAKTWAIKQYCKLVNDQQ